MSSFPTDSNQEIRLGAQPAIEHGLIRPKRSSVDDSGFLQLFKEKANDYTRGMNPTKTKTKTETTTTVRGIDCDIESEGRIRTLRAG